MSTRRVIGYLLAAVFLIAVPLCVAYFAARSKFTTAEVQIWATATTGAATVMLAIVTWALAQVGHDQQAQILEQRSRERRLAEGLFLQNAHFIASGLRDYAESHIPKETQLAGMAVQDPIPNWDEYLRLCSEAYIWPGSTWQPAWGDLYKASIKFIGARSRGVRRDWKSNEEFQARQQETVDAMESLGVAADKFREVAERHLEMLNTEAEKSNSGNSYPA